MGLSYHIQHASVRIGMWGGQRGARTQGHWSELRLTSSATQRASCPGAGPLLNEGLVSWCFLRSLLTPKCNLFHSSSDILFLPWPPYKLQLLRLWADVCTRGTTTTGGVSKSSQEFRLKVTKVLPTLPRFASPMPCGYFLLCARWQGGQGPGIRCGLDLLCKGTPWLFCTYSTGIIKWVLLTKSPPETGALGQGDKHM